MIIKTAACLMLSIISILPLVAQEINAKIVSITVDESTKEFFVTYDIQNGNSNDLYLIEFEYLEYFSFNKIVPVKGSLSGDVGDYAVRGGRNKQFVWNFSKQPQSALEYGEFRIEIIQLRKEVSTKLNRLYGRQNRLRIKLDQPNIRSKKRKRLSRKMDKVNRKIQSRSRSNN